MDFLKKIHDISKTYALPPDTLLCTMDVNALFTNIPHEEDMDACHLALEEGRDLGTKPSATFICTLIHLILTLNFFTFCDKTYIQTHGTAMGTCMAPTYVNIFVGAIESRLLCSFLDKPHRKHLSHLDPWRCQTRSIQPTYLHISPYHQIHIQYYRPLTFHSLT